MRTAGKALRSAAGTAIPVAFNLGIAVGAAAGSEVLGRSGVDEVALLAGALAIAGTAGLTVTVAPGLTRAGWCADDTPHTLLATPRAPMEEHRCPRKHGP
jgi:hypothetical protein